MTMPDIWESIRKAGVLPVAVVDRASDAPTLGEALLKAGLGCIEITFRTPDAAQAVGKLTTAYPDMLVGAGTIIRTDQAAQAVDAGARFIISPGFDPEVAEWCLGHNIPIAPGVATPSEIMMAVKRGIRLLKFFPAEAMGGIKTLKAISEPFGGVEYIPTGGIDPGNLADYLRLPAVAACGGTWMVKRELIAAGKFDEISRLAREALSLAASTRSKA